MSLMGLLAHFERNVFFVYFASIADKRQSVAMDKKTQTLTIRLTPKDKAELVRIAKADKRPPAQLAAIIIEEWLEAQGKK